MHRYFVESDEEIEFPPGTIVHIIASNWSIQINDRDREIYCEKRDPVRDNIRKIIREELSNL